MFNKLCQPAKFYFILATISYILILLQNINSRNRFHLGMYSCHHSQPFVIMLIHALYILFWTWLLNLICSVNKNISWIIVLFPYVMLFIGLGVYMMNGIHKEQKEDMRSTTNSQATLSLW
jgi:hypothetical protein